MTEAQGEAPPSAGEPSPTAPAPEPEPRLAHAGRPGLVWMTVVLAAILLVLIVAGVALSPFWAPAVAPLLPWGDRRAASQYAALATRLAAVEQRPIVRSADIDALEGAQAALARRVDQVEAAAAGVARADTAATAAQAAAERLGHRLDALAAQASSSAGLIPPMQQELARLGSGAADLAGRIGAIEHQLRAKRGLDRSGSALLVTLLQIREAVERGRPFPAEYNALAALAQGDPKLAAAAAPLAEAAHDGVAGRAVLQQRLSDLAGQIAAAAAPPAAGDWRGKALAELRSLVTIRRTDGAGLSPSEAAVGAAERALSHGDLGAAVAALGALEGAHAQAAQPWLAMARARLAVEEALALTQKLLVARLDAAAPTSPPASAPASSPPPSSPPPSSPPPSSPPSSSPSAKAPS